MKVKVILLIEIRCVDSHESATLTYDKS